MYYNAQQPSQKPYDLQLDVLKSPKYFSTSGYVGSRSLHTVQEAFNILVLTQPAGFRTTYFYLLLELLPEHICAAQRLTESKVHCLISSHKVAYLYRSCMA